MKRKHSKIKLKNKVLSTLLVLVIAEAITIPSIFLLTKTPDQLDASNIKTLCNTTNYRSKTLESEMYNWSNLSSWLAETTSIMEEMEQQSGQAIHKTISDASFRQQLLNQLSNSVLVNLRRQLTTGAFIILSNDNTETSYDTIHLRDLNPYATSDSNHDILVETGLGKSCFHQGFTLDTNWTKKLTLGEYNDFYTKPMQAALHYPELESENLGYWSDAMQFKENDIKVITYTVPLLDSTGTPYGVIGVEISLDYLHKFMDSQDISIDENASYFLSKKCNNSDNLKSIYIDNTYYQNFFGAQALSLSDTYKHKDIKRIIADGVPTDTVCYSSSLNLYHSNTPFATEEWTLSGVVGEKELYKSSSRFFLALIVALVISLIIAVICSIATSSFMFRPLWTLMDGLRNNSETNFKLPRTNIMEIDNLAAEIEQLRQSAYESGSKAADIIETSNVPIGIYEFNEALPNKVFCTKKFFELTELPIDGWHENYMNRSHFEKLLESFFARCSLLPDETRCIYSFASKKGTTRYLELKTLINEQNRPCIFMDVTSQIHETEKIKHERDYDILTNLYNRRAFLRIVTDMINNKKIVSGVLSMWDLDNLKFFNDTYGHDMGDQYIRMFAEEFHNLNASHYIASHVAGDEFMLFIYDGEVDDMCRKLEDLHASFLQKKITLPDGESIGVSVSAGMAVYGIDSDNYETLTRFADFAMYEVKHQEKGAIKRFHYKQYEKDYVLVNGVLELNKILEKEKVTFAFQPIVDIQKKEIFAYEALLRPQSQLLCTPELLLRVAEKQSKLHIVEHLTWFHALEAYFSQFEDKPDTKLFINSISGQCIARDEFQMIQQCYQDYLSLVVMEITEDSQPDEATERKKREFCLANGIEIAMDDYGVGYSTNTVLMNNSFGYVKIDISMIQNIHCSNEKLNFVKGIINYCHECNTKVIAEGVETKEEYDIVKSLGVNYVQGFYLMKPKQSIHEIEIDYRLL